MSDSTNADQNSSDPGKLVDQTGRELGTRALQTRQRILDATVAELAVKPMRDLRVIDIARRVGSSPATFYQYFKDIEDVVLQLADSIMNQIPRVVGLIHEGWEGPEGFEHSKRMVRTAIENFEKNGPIMRVRNTAADEGDERFREVRVRAVMPMITAISGEIASSQKRAATSGETMPTTAIGPAQGHIDPRVGGMLMFAMIDRMAMYYENMLAAGIEREAIIDTAATIFQSVLTARK